MTKSATKATRPMPNAAYAKTPDRLAVEDAIKAATRRGEGSTVEGLATRLQMTPKRVRTAVRNMMTANMLVSTRSAGCVAASYKWAPLASKKEPTDTQRRWSSGHVVLQTPTNGPGYTPMRLPTSTGSATPLPHKVCNASMPPSDPYLAPELRPNASMPPERMTAYRLPSRVGNQLFYPGGRVEAIAATDLQAGA